MAQSKSINAAELDVDLIAENFKTYLKSQEQYKDYNFEGSNLSILVDILAYNTHYNNLYTNFSLNEVFLDSAVKRDSVVSLAKGLGYTPRSASASKAVLSVIVTGVNSEAPDILILPKGTIFLTTNSGKKYSYSTNQPYTALLQNDGYIFTGVEIFEGDVVSNTYITREGTRYVIPNTGCDLSTLKVKVQESTSSSNFDNYKLSTDIVESKSDSLVYYVKEIENGLYEVYFGENVVGKQPINGNVINLEYRVCSGSVPNGAKSFSYNGDSLANGLVSTITTEQSISGKDIETIESIKVNAPNFFSTQNRGVNTLDYKTLISSVITDAEFISVWGGEDASPKQYGKVFFSIKPEGRRSLSQIEKKSLENQIRNKMTVGIVPEFIDPDVIDIVLDSTVYYDPELTNLTPSDLNLAVLSTISEFNQNVVIKNNFNYKHSLLTTAIDSTDKSITNNITKVSIVKRYVPEINVKSNVSISLNNPILSIKSDLFYVRESQDIVYLESVGTNIYLYSINNNIATQVLLAGTINQSLGKINFSGFTVTLVNDPNGEIPLFITPKSNDVISKLNSIASINLALSNVNVVIDDTTNYIFA